MWRHWRRFGPEVVDLEFKMRCFGVFAAQNSKNLCFTLQKQQHEAGRVCKHYNSGKQWTPSRGIDERQGEESSCGCRQEQEQEQWQEQEQGQEQWWQERLRCETGGTQTATQKRRGEAREGEAEAVGKETQQQ